jgi:hypothetical protein
MRAYRFRHHPRTLVKVTFEEGRVVVRRHLIAVLFYVSLVPITFVVTTAILKAAKPNMAGRASAVPSPCSCADRSDVGEPNRPAIQNFVRTTSSDF